MNEEKERFLVLKYMRIIEDNYKKRSDLREILYDFKEELKKLLNKRGKK